jgi:predicted metal-dependent peptidase
MVEAFETQTTKRQKKQKLDILAGLTNVNYTQEIVNAKDADRVGGQQVVIQFRDNEEQEVGV